MTKVIKEQYYISWTYEEDIYNKCKELNNYYDSNKDVYYDFSEARIGDDEEIVCCINIVVESETYGECNDIIKKLLKDIKKIFGEKPKLIISVKSERV